MNHAHIDETNERLAREFYDTYCAAVGGKAFNGDPLPPASEFFEDETKVKQANAYRLAVAAIVPPGSYRMQSDDREPSAIRAMVQLQHRTSDNGVEYRWSDAPDTVYASRVAAEARFGVVTDPDDSFFYDPFDADLDEPLPAGFTSKETEFGTVVRHESFLADDTDLDEPLPAQQHNACDGETCESCQ